MKKKKPQGTKTKETVKKKAKNNEELNEQEQALLAEIKLGQRKEYREYVRQHNRELRRLKNEANGIFEPDYDYE